MLATIVVRAGDGNPSSIERATSRNSGARSTSSAPGTGYSEKTGGSAPGASRSVESST